MLVLTVTRRCNLRCSYCPTAKDGWPSLTPDDARRAMRLFVNLVGGGDVKLFGGEPLLVPETVDAALAAARNLPAVRWVYLSTNGLGLNGDLLERFAREPKLVLTVSIDGRAEDNRRLRRALPGVPDAYDHLVRLKDRLLRMPRLVVTQTIAPAGASRMLTNFEHLRQLGFRRFNFLPGYYLPWNGEQLVALRRGFDAIHESLRAAWDRGERLYVRNLFTRASTPFFNSGLIVDADRSIHFSNVGLAGSFEELRTETRLGDLDVPPTLDALKRATASAPALLARRVPSQIWQSTLAADAELTRFCRQLYPAYASFYRRRHAA